MARQITKRRTYDVMSRAAAEQDSLLTGCRAVKIHSSHVDDNAPLSDTFRPKMGIAEEIPMAGTMSRLPTGNG
jgi:hypothetical protein